MKTNVNALHINKAPKSSLFQRLLSTNILEISSLNSSVLFQNLQKKLLNYQNTTNFNLSKTYTNFLSMSNSPLQIKNIQKTWEATPIKQKVKLYRNNNSISLNENKSMRKTKKSIIEYEKTFIENRENAEGSLKRNFALARMLIREISKLHKNDDAIEEEKFKIKCEELKENINEILIYLQKEPNEYGEFISFTMKNSLIKEEPSNNNGDIIEKKSFINENSVILKDINMKEMSSLKQQMKPKAVTPLTKEKSLIKENSLIIKETSTIKEESSITIQDDKKTSITDFKSKDVFHVINNANLNDGSIESSMSIIDIKEKELSQKNVKKKVVRGRTSIESLKALNSESKDITNIVGTESNFNRSSTGFKMEASNKGTPISKLFQTLKKESSDNFGTLNVKNQIIQAFSIKDQSLSKIKDEKLIELGSNNAVQKGFFKYLPRYRKNPNAYKFYMIKEAYDRFLSELIFIIQNLNLRELYVWTMLLHAKMCYECKEIHKAIAILKQAKEISKELGFNCLKMKCYERLGKAFQILKSFNIALRYFIKMLEMSWVCKNTCKELVAYDLIGLQYFYMGNLELANYFHKRLLEGEIEPVNSNLRQLSYMKYKKYKTYNNYSLPSYIALRTEMDLNKSLMIPSSDEEGDLKVEELLGSLNSANRSDHKVCNNGKNYIKYKEDFESLKESDEKKLLKYPKIEECTEKMQDNSKGINKVINFKRLLENANKNIRPRKKSGRVKSMDFETDGIFDFNKLIKMKGNDCKEVKETHLRLNHLSPNRFYSKPNVYELQMNKLVNDENEKLKKRVIFINQRYNDKIHLRFKSMIEKFRNNLKVSLMQLEFYSAKLRNDSKRKYALLCSPLLKEDIKKSSNKFRTFIKNANLKFGELKR